MSSETGFISGAVWSWLNSLSTSDVFLGCHGTLNHPKYAANPCFWEYYALGTFSVIHQASTISWLVTRLSLGFSNVLDWARACNPVAEGVRESDKTCQWPVSWVG
jgi:hypothetical protein